MCSYHLLLKVMLYCFTNNFTLYIIVKSINDKVNVFDSFILVQRKSIARFCLYIDIAFLCFDYERESSSFTGLPHYAYILKYNRHFMSFMVVSFNDCSSVEFYEITMLHSR
jgi:hypothetical protein